MESLTVRVAGRRMETSRIVRLELRDPAGADLPPFTAGAHVDVFIRDGLVRQYSLCNAPSERHRYEIGVLRCEDSRGGSTAVHDELAEGQLVRISAPRNQFPLAPARRSLLFAGGIGITPLLSMAEALSAEGREFELHYNARGPADAAFRDRIEAGPFADRVHVHYDDGPEAQRLDLPGLLATAQDDVHLYVCGPSGYIAYVTGYARDRGWAPGQVHVEHFKSEPATAGGGSVTAFQVELARDGRRFDVPPDRSIFEVLDAAGVDIPVSCEQGICGTCLTRVLAGLPDHRDVFLTDEEHARNDQMTVCCSRSRSPLLVLDL